MRCIAPAVFLPSRWVPTHYPPPRNYSKLSYPANTGVRQTNWLTMVYHLPPLNAFFRRLCPSRGEQITAVFASGGDHTTEHAHWGYYMIAAVAVQLLTGFYRVKGLEAEGANFSFLHRVRGRFLCFRLGFCGFFSSCCGVSFFCQFSFFGSRKRERERRPMIARRFLLPQTGRVDFLSTAQ